MAGDEVVGRVADDPRDQGGHGGRAPRSAHVAGRPQRGSRPDVHALGGRVRLVHPHHRITATGGGVPRANTTAGLAVERREAQRVRALVAKDELNRRGAEAAVAVVEEKRAATA